MVKAGFHLVLIIEFGSEQLKSVLIGFWLLF